MAGSSDAQNVVYRREQALIHRLGREELYKLVWSEPGQKVAARFGVSDVWFAKVCRAANIPRPPRGYWAKVRSGKRPKQAPLPPLKPQTLGA